MSSEWQYKAPGMQGVVKIETLDQKTQNETVRLNTGAGVKLGINEEAGGKQAGKRHLKLKM